MQPNTYKNPFVFTLLRIVFTLVGTGLIIGGYLVPPGSLTDDGFSLRTFLYSLGGFFVLFPLLLFGTISYFLRRASEREAYLFNNGIKGKARVLNMRPTNISINNVPQMMLDLEVVSSLGERYQTSYKKTLPQQYYNIIRPDLDLPVYIDPADRNKLYVDFQQAWLDLARQGSMS